MSTSTPDGQPSKPGPGAEPQADASAAGGQRRTRIIVAATVAAVAVLAWPVSTLFRGDAGEAAPEPVQTYTPVPTHVRGAVDYEQEPPVGGPHNGAWLNCGIYTEPVRNENVVHSLEHGAVWVAFRPGLPSADFTTLVEALPSAYTVLSPYPGLEADAVATGWGRQLTLTGVDDPRLSQFLRDYVQGPQAPEPGAPCTGGVDETGEPAQ